MKQVNVFEVCHLPFKIDSNSVTTRKLIPSCAYLIKNFHCIQFLLHYIPDPYYCCPVTKATIGSDFGKDSPIDIAIPKDKKTGVGVVHFVALHLRM